jgi:hypothetical protein
VPFETVTEALVEDTLLQLERANLEDILLGETLVIRSDQATLRVTQTHHTATQLDTLEGGELSDVARTRDEDFGLGVGEGDATGGVACVEEWDHLEAVVDETVACGFGAGVGASPVGSFAGEDTDPLVTELLVCAEQVTDLATTGSLYKM